MTLDNNKFLLKLKVNKFGEMLFSEGVVTRERCDSFFILKSTARCLAAHVYGDVSYLPAVENE